MGKVEADVIRKVRDLERSRDGGKVRKAGQRWTVASWLTHWIENIAVPPAIKDSSHASYRVDVYVHLIPGLGAYRLERLTPEHLEKLYAKMQRQGSAAGTAHHVHRTVRAALNAAVRRGYLTQNPAAVAKSPTVEPGEIEPYEVDEVKRLLKVASELPRNSARWALALALGLRQGEALGLTWADVDLDRRRLKVRRGRQRPQYEHGCGDTCGRKAGYCPDRQQVNPDVITTKSRAGRRTIGLPSQLVALLRTHRAEQDREKAEAGNLWEGGDWVFATPTGGPLIPNTDYHQWKDLLQQAGLRDARLHDARHTAATVLLLLGVPERTVMAIMGWSSTGMAARYQHVTDGIRETVADQVDGLLWGSSETGDSI
jgi:integrase